jgi:hypothetical protein
MHGIEAPTVDLALGTLEDPDKEIRIDDSDSRLHPE